jgi:hypothetical protein
MCLKDLFIGTNIAALVVGGWLSAIRPASPNDLVFLATSGVLCGGSHLLFVATDLRPGSSPGFAKTFLVSFVPFVVWLGVATVVALKSG